jgi:hypothetical protein
MSDQPIPHRAEDPRQLQHERRTAVRFPSQRAALVSPVGDETGMEWPGRVRDISAKGVGLILGISFEPGTMLAVQFLFDRGLPFRVEATVMRVLGESCGFVHGCQFTRRLTNDELTALVQ